jgi:hypothetical protein
MALLSCCCRSSTGLLGRAVDGRHLELDLRAQASARWLALIGGAKPSSY